MLPSLSPKQTIELTVREEWGRILASLVKTLGDFQLAEDCLQDALISAMEHWQRNGLPASPAGWLITVARRKAIDRLRQQKNFATKQNELAYLYSLENQGPVESQSDAIPDKRLELIFTCCHPVLDEKSRIALTLRTLGGLTSNEIASAFLDKPDAMKKRLTRAKAKIAKAGIAYSIPEGSELRERLSSVLHDIYLIFNEGYSATSGDVLLKTDLCEEAIRLSRIIRHLMPQETEVTGLLALMLLHNSRRHARSDIDGEMIALEKQNRLQWDRAKISEGVDILKETLPKRQVGPFQLQASISAAHALSSSWEKTNWQEIAALYNLLFTIQPSPVVRINQAIAVSYSESLEDALAMLDEAAETGELDRYQPYFAARADVLARVGQTTDAKACFETAIALSENEQEKWFLYKKLADLIPMSSV